MSTAIVPNVGTETRPSDVLSGAVAPTGFANEIFKRMQSAPSDQAPAADAAKPEDQKPETQGIVTAPPEGSTAQALEDAGKAPEPKKATSVSIRALVKESNLPVEFKDEVASLAYEGKAAREAGLSVDVVKQFKELGISLPSVMERIRVHPTIDDARRDAQLAGEMRTLINDFIHNPKEMVRKLRGTSQASNRPEVFSEFVAAAAEFIEKEARSTWIGKLDREVRFILSKLAGEAAAEKNEEMQISVANIQQKLGYVPGTQAMSAPVTEDPRVQALTNELDELKGKKRQNDSGSREAFIQNATQGAQKAIFQEVVNRFLATRPTGMDEEESKKCVGEAFENIGRELLNNANFKIDFDNFKRGDVSQRGFDQALKFAVDRAIPLIPFHLNAAIAYHGKRALTTAQVTDTKQKAAAANTDAAKVGGVAPTPPVKKSNDVIASVRAKRAGGMRLTDALFTTLNEG